MWKINHKWNCKNEQGQTNKKRKLKRKKCKRGRLTWGTG